LEGNNKYHSKNADFSFKNSAYGDSLFDIDKNQSQVNRIALEKSYENRQQIDSVSLSKTNPKFIGKEKPIFNSHLLASSNFNPKQKFVGNKDWFLGILIVIFLILGWIQVNHGKRLIQIFNAFKSNLYVNLIIRENDSLMQRASIALNTVFILVTALFIYQINLFYNWILNDSYGVVFFFQISCLILLIYLIKKSLLQITGFVFKTQEINSKYIFNIFLMNKILGIALLPIVICIAFLPQCERGLIPLGLAIVFFSYIYRLVRGLILGGSESNLSIFYLFLYLCTFEILPLIVLLKVFFTWVL